MTEVEKVLREIRALREAIQIDWDELYSNPLREQEREDVRKHLEICQAELKALMDRLSMMGN